MIRCSECKQLKDPDQFWKRSVRSEKRNSVCKVCISRYRYQLRRENKLRIVGLLGGKCATCGHTSKSGVSLSIDHRNPKGKGASVSNICSWAWGRIETELKTGDCWLLCMNCHYELEYQRNDDAICRSTEGPNLQQPVGILTKKCCTCRNFLALDQFTNRKDGKYGKASECKICAKRRNYKRRRQNKLKVVVRLGGKCAICAHTSDTGGSLSVDHRNPDGKGLGAENLYMWSWDRILLELETGDCWLLCVNCHMEVEDERRGKAAKYGR